MADEDEGEITSEGKLLSQHRKEKRELQAKIQTLKHTICKSDKKKKKEITCQITNLESELELKHKQELAELKNHHTDQESLAGQVNNIILENDDSTDTSDQPSKLNKAQRKREKKALQEKERQQRIAEQEIENLKGSRSIEAKKLKSLLNQRKLKTYEIPSDGNCLYHAFQHQLKTQGIDCSVENLRKQCADFILSHADEFMPFLTKPDSEDAYSLEEFEAYCREIASTTTWGGHLEIRALSSVFKLPVEVVQADGPIIKIGEEFDAKNCIILTYHRHAYHLGEHYNSVRVIEDEDDDMFEN